MKHQETIRRFCSPPRRRRGSLRAAFTFVEMLVSLMIMGIVIVAVAGATYVSTETYQANQNDAQLGGSARVIMERIAREIRSASSVTCSTNQLTINTSSGDQYVYVREGGLFYCDRTEGAGTERYYLLGSGDSVSVTGFEITVSTTTVDSVTVTSLVTVQLNLQANGQPLVVSASACPRQNVSP